MPLLTKTLTSMMLVASLVIVVKQTRVSSASFLTTSQRQGNRQYLPVFGQRQRCVPQIRLSSTTSDEATNVFVSDPPEPSLSSSNASSPPLGRLPRNNLSIDLRTVSSELQVVLSHLAARRSSVDTIDAANQIAASTKQRNEFIQERDGFLNQRKTSSALVGKLMRQRATLTPEQETELNSAKETSVRATQGADLAEQKLAELQTYLDDLLNNIPNLLDDRVPNGKDEFENEEIYKWGDLQALPNRLGWNNNSNGTETSKKSTFVPLWHDDVAAKLGGYWSDRAVRLSGARFVALSGVIAQLERALTSFFLDLHTNHHGYTEVSVPFVVSRSTLEGTSQLPKFKDDLFAISPNSHTCNGEDAYLIPTAEVPLTNLHRDEVLDESDLPISYVAATPCFRAEAGSYGRDTRGLIRTHQFHKVELVKITTTDTSNTQHEELTRHAEACLQALELPYRKVRLCSGDIGFAAQHCYDLEVWLPGANEYREISSCSNCGNFQTRRMSLRYRPQPKEGATTKSKPQFCHTINGSGLAVGRTLVAVLENYQRPDGSVEVPHVLRPYMGHKEVLKIPKSYKYTNNIK